MRSPARFALSVLCFAFLLSLGRLSADRDPRVRLRVPSHAACGQPSLVGVELSNDLRAELRRRGGHINVTWRSSQGHGSLTRAADSAGLDATFDLAGLDAGGVMLSAAVTSGAETLTSGLETSTLFSVSLEPSTVSVAQGEPISSIAVRVLGLADTTQLFAAGYRFVNAVTGADVASGDIAFASFAPDGQGNVVATPTFQLPAAFTGTATLTVTIAVLAVDLLGNRVVESASASATVTVQPAGVVPLVVTFVTASGATFDAGSRAAIEFTVQTSDPATTSAFFTVLDTANLPATSGAATLTTVDATHMSGVASWDIPSTAAGSFTVVVLAQRAMEQVSASLPIAVNPAPGVSVSFVETGPILATAGAPSTVHFVIRGLATLAAVSLTATLTESATGALLSSAVLSSDVLVPQPDGSFTGESTFTFPPETTTRPLDARLALAVQVNGGAVASAEIAVRVEPVSVPIAVTIVNAPAEARAGDSVPLTIGVAGVTVAQVGALSWTPRGTPSRRRTSWRRSSRPRTTISRPPCR